MLQEAETRLPEAEQAHLAELVEVFLATSGPDADFTPAELADLQALDAAPFDPAPAAEVAALFARRRSCLVGRGSPRQTTAMAS